MKFDCDQCGTRYNIADEKVRRKVLKIRCRVCEHVITVRGADLERKDAEAPAAGGEGAPSLADGWFAAPEGEELGPMPLDRLQGMVELGEIAADTLVWCEGMPDWIAVGAVPELVAHLPKTSSLEDETTSTFELHDRIDDSLRRPLLSTPPPQSARAEPEEPDEPDEPEPRGGIGWETPDERPTVAEPSIGPLVPGVGGGGGDAQRRVLVVLIVLAVIVLLALVGVIAWWVSQPPGQRPGLSLAPASAPPATAAPVAPTPAGAAQAPAAAPAPAAPVAGASAAEGPPPKTLTQAQVEAVIAGHKDSIETCRGEHAGALPARKDVLAFDLRPTGRVSNPQLRGPLAGTGFAQCLQTAARSWRFPVFTGEPIPVQYPFELTSK